MTRFDQENLGADLSAYIDGELSPERTREIECLLAESPEARKLLDQLRGVSRQLGDLPRVPAPKSLVDRVLRLYKRTADPETPELRPSRIPTLWRLSRVLASAAVVALCFCAGWFMHGRLASPGDIGLAPHIAPAESEHAFVARDKGEPALHEENALAPSSPNPTQSRERRVEKSAPDQVAAKDGVPSDHGQRWYTSLDSNRDRSIEDLTDAAFAKSDSSEDAVPPTLDDDSRERLLTLGYADGSHLSETREIPSPDVTTPPRLAAKEENALTSEQSLPTAAPEPVPSVQICITPENAAQYAAALQTVASWQGMERDIGEEYRRFVSGADRKSAGHQPRQISIELPPERVAGLLGELEREAPQQVSVALNFRPEEFAKVQEMLLPESFGMPFSKQSTMKKTEDLAKGEAPAESPADDLSPAAAESASRADNEFYAKRVQDLPTPSRTPAARGRISSAPESEKQDPADTQRSRGAVLRAPFSEQSSEKAAARRGGGGRGSGRAAYRGLEYPPTDRQPTVADVARSSSPKLTKDQTAPAEAVQTESLASVQPTAPSPLASPNEDFITQPAAEPAAEPVAFAPVDQMRAATTQPESKAPPAAVARSISEARANKPRGVIVSIQILPPDVTQSPNALQDPDVIKTLSALGYVGGDDSEEESAPPTSQPASQPK